MQSITQKDGRPGNLDIISFSQEQSMGYVLCAGRWILNTIFAGTVHNFHTFFRYQLM